MRNSRLYTPQSLAAGSQVELTGSQCHYLARVLRVSDGDEITLFNGDGFDYCGKVIETRKQSVTVKLDSRLDPANESPLHITLVQAISRGERMDYCLQKATELGVSAIRLLTSSRVEVRLNENRLVKRMAHWQAVVRSACEQSGRARVPEVKVPLSLPEWLSRSDGQTRLVLDPLADIRLSSCPLKTSGLSIVAGPEGGFSDAELQQLKEQSVTPVSLGPRVLRTETAGPVAIAVLQTMAGDF